MAYREDLDAALARVDALQHESSALEAENTRLRRDLASAMPTSEVIERTTAPGATALGALVLLATGALVGMAATLRLERPAHPARSAEEALSAVSREPYALDPSTLELDACVASIGAPPHVAGAYRSRADIEAIVLTAAPCRDSLPDLIAHARVDYPHELALHAWQDAEDELANRIALVTSAFQDDPLAEREHPDAMRLWSEYERTLAVRNAALDLWLRGRRWVARER